MKQNPAVFVCRGLGAVTLFGGFFQGSFESYFTVLTEFRDGIVCLRFPYPAYEACFVVRERTFVFAMANSTFPNNSIF